METVGFECYNNGTVRPSVMKVKDEEPHPDDGRNEFYGSFLARGRKTSPHDKNRRKKGADKAQ